MRTFVIRSLSDVPQGEWDHLLATAKGGTPFVRWDFLSSLEDSGCVGEGTGWAPCHLLVRDESERLIGAAPLYLKSHSMGEYVFDHAWADALTRAGMPYYPKLQCASPFTPVTGPRLFAATDAGIAPTEIQAALVRAALSSADSARASSLHVTFHDEELGAHLAGMGMLSRTGVQFHFTNENYRSFNDFLATLASSKRKTLRKERERAHDGRTVARLVGREITRDDWDFFFRCYMDTGSRKWGKPYLNRRFFELLSERMGESCVLFVASQAGERVAAALNLFDANAIYGRYWGCVVDVPFLHFELCYYQAIDFAIERGLGRVEAGAQGEHKLARGYAPSKTHSSHWIRHEGLRAAIAKYLAQETPAIAHEIEQLAEHTPFRKPG